ncbi:MAG: hypothetical protein Q9175_003447 [Cornicularia normoerica]
MSRSAAEATRFTATSPHAYAKPSPIRASPSTYSASSTPRPSPIARLDRNARTPPSPIDPKKYVQGSAPPAETAAEKVARLRQARLREREAQMSTWDKIVIRGRVWADRAHRITVYTLLGSTVVIVIVAGFSLTDMIVHNRRKRAAFFAEQHAIYSQRLIEAIETEISGMPLDEDQTLILNRERIRVQAEEAAKERTWRKRIKGFFIGDLKHDEEGGESGEEVAVPSEGQILQTLGVDEFTILKRAGQADRGSGPTTTDLENSREEGKRDGSGILQAVAEKRREGERAMEAAGVKGGPLDRMGEGAVQAVGGKIHATEEKVGNRGGWSSWWAGK